MTEYTGEGLPKCGCGKDAEWWIAARKNMIGAEFEAVCNEHRAEQLSARLREPHPDKMALWPGESVATMAALYPDRNVAAEEEALPSLADSPGSKDSVTAPSAALFVQANTECAAALAENAKLRTALSVIREHVGRGYADITVANTVLGRIDQEARIALD